MHKLIYVQKRRPGMTALEFKARWRQHGCIALGTDEFMHAVRRYVHCDPIAGAAIDFDGIGELWYETVESQAAMMRSAGYRRRVPPDEPHVFADPRGGLGVTGTERFLIDRGGGAVKVFVFHKRRGDLPRANFAGLFAAHGGRLAAEAVIADALLRFVQVDALADRPSSFTGVDELWFADQDAARAALARPEWSRLLAASEAFADPYRRLVAVTTEVVLRDALAAAPG